MKSSAWILIFVILFCILTALCLFLYHPAKAVSAEIYSDGALVRTVSLQQDETFTIESAYGSNTITVAQGKLAVTAASCPDHVCMSRGYTSGGLDIICLPNRLVIHFTGDSIDAVLG